ncbi:hypothetical protein GCM10010234_47310 [Streptomyces hawaiiensis]
MSDHSPWDITVRKDGRETHIEVTGSTTTFEAVDLTEGEVATLKAYPPAS